VITNVGKIRKKGKIIQNETIAVLASSPYLIGFCKILLAAIFFTLYFRGANDNTELYYKAHYEASLTRKVIVAYV
jgi:hypothetical protein